MIILHYTAGVSAQSSPRYLARPDVKASAHLVIGRLGKIIQLVSFDVEAWHAGQSSYAGRTCLNRFSIGIELDNLGRLAWTAGRFVAECGRRWSWSRCLWMSRAKRPPTGIGIPGDRKRCCGRCADC